MEPLLLRPAEAAKALGLSRGRIYELLAAQEIGSIKEGSARLIPVDELRAWVDRRRASAPDVGRSGYEVPHAASD